MKKSLLSILFFSALSFTAFSQCQEVGTGSTPVTTGYLAGQAITASCSGNVNYVQVTAASTGTVPAGTLNIYAGAGTGTTPIYTQAFSPITISNVGDPVTINVTGSVPVTSASQYTFEFFMNLDVYAGFGTYAGGDAYQGGVLVSGIDVAFVVDISVATDVEELETTTTSVYPNPATNLLNIETAEKIMTVNIYSVNGALVKTDNQAAIDISSLENGMYIVSVQTESGINQTRFVKQ
ncbi:MAG: T9SS type A sorting domain-containing protein [Flavobacteriales bacterium]|nr:T9SS type A sorting domain-containing protein [Flavobacteriales bacterium]